MLKQILNGLIETLAGRQKEIIVQRFGVLNAKPKTLAALGFKYDITRERVRQIESTALKGLIKYAEADTNLKNIYAKCVDHIKKLGGVRRADYLVEDLKLVLRDPGVSYSYVKFLFSIFGTPILFSENKDFYSFWYLDIEQVKESKKFILKISQVMKNKKEALIDKKQFDQIFAQTAKTSNVQDFIALNFILNSKNFSVNPFGDFGLIEWPEINPKTVRDKSYLILKKVHAPLHFRDIAKEINKIKFDSKKAHPQTVHNELIKDQRFVLVGRGLYSLREFGFEPGTAREILTKILKKNGPAHLDRIVQLVSEQRVLKHNTILLNLQNKKHFKKLSDGRFHIA